MLGMFLVTISYFLINIGFIAAIGGHGIAQSDVVGLVFSLYFFY